ncbi:MAG TPA: Mut7-C RNAse domain-containing protein [Candidatus Krumholzibacteria bacterium]|nr:Mut7-C RNAse domain-containing protein [Candidatus Krumholzibacteria bacterium]
MLTITIEFDRLLVPLMTRRDARDTGVVVRRLAGTTTLADAIEAVGIPRVEASGAVDADGRPRGLGERVTDGDHLRVAGVATADPGPARFLGDRHLGALVRLLRLFGFDTAAAAREAEADLARRARDEDRILLSRNRALLKRRELGSAMLVREDDPDAQAAAVLRRYGLADRCRLGHLCPACGAAVRAVAKTAVADRIPPRTAAWLDDYRLCAGCGRLYWDGTHLDRLGPRLEAIRAAARRPA